MSYARTLTTEAAFRRYEEVRDRLPAAGFAAETLDCGGLLEIADEVDAFVLDSFGVLNVGETAIPGAIECLAELRARGKRLIVLTNAASYPLSEALRKYARLGFDFSEDEVVSSRDVAVARIEALAPGAAWGAIAAPGDGFEDIASDVRHWDGGACDGFLMLSSIAMTDALVQELEASLREHPRPLVIANPDLVAPRETGLSLEPGYYAHLLADLLGIRPAFYGKPYGEAFADAFARLGDIPPERIAMVGDTLHTDILGGRAAGARTVLVRDHGLFAGRDTGPFIAASGIVPDFSCASI